MDNFRLNDVETIRVMRAGGNLRVRGVTSGDTLIQCDSGACRFAAPRIALRFSLRATPHWKSRLASHLKFSNAPATSISRTSAHRSRSAECAEICGRAGSAPSRSAAKSPGT